jgi:type II secretory pathway component PulF
VPVYRYEASDAARSPVSGEIDADSVSHALTLLEQRGWSVQWIGQMPIQPAAHSDSTPERPPARQATESDWWLGQLEELLPRLKVIAPALRACSEELPRSHQRMRRFINVLERADPVEAAQDAAGHPEDWIPLVGAARSNSDPANILFAFIKQVNWEGARAGRWRRVLLYPLVIGSAALAVFVLISLFIVPTFYELFADFQLSLPSLTMAVLTIADFLKSRTLLIVVGALIVFVFALVVASRWLPPSLSDWFGRRFGKPIGRTAANARIAWFAADLMEGGFDVSDALRIAAGATNRSRYRSAAAQLADAVQLGGRNAPTPRSPLKATMQHALLSDYSTAARVRLLRELGRSDAERVRKRFSWAEGIVEPVAILLVGLLVGLVVLAVIMPMFSLVTNLSASF